LLGRRPAEHLLHSDGALDVVVADQVDLAHGPRTEHPHVMKPRFLLRSQAALTACATGKHGRATDSERWLVWHELAEIDLFEHRLLGNERRRKAEQRGSGRR